MALATLCSVWKRQDKLALEFTAFVVDHQLRSGSTEEAKWVCNALQSQRESSSIYRLL